MGLICLYHLLRHAKHIFKQGLLCWLSNLFNSIYHTSDTCAKHWGYCTELERCSFCHQSACFPDISSKKIHNICWCPIFTKALTGWPQLACYPESRLEMMWDNSDSSDMALIHKFIAQYGAIVAASGFNETPEVIFWEAQCSLHDVVLNN